MHAALILAGGSARRLSGVDKPLLDVGGRTIIEHIKTVLDAAPVAISANGDPARFARFGLPVLDDGAFAGEGPLAGLLAGLCWADSIGAGDLLTVPGDTPFVPRGLAAALAPSPSCAASNGRVHHLVALWPVACRERLHDLLSLPGRRDVAHFARSMAMRTVDFPTSKWDPFLNVNTPEDLAVARAVARGET